MAPIAAEWSSPTWHTRLSGPADFVAAFMPVQAAAPAGPVPVQAGQGQGASAMEVGGRWALGRHCLD